jgi:DNA polymerase III subunit gamma/tau
VAETSLYRRHRPQSFDEVVGQTHVVRTLANAIERDRVHHAYLFVGSRGTGKTSLAKILARSLNCVQGPTLNPCGVCEPCRGIAAGTSLDVIEMDAASNRSVDDIRELRERVGYAPAAGRWKVYILDEAHMLTREAWNAFLKTLEEPPPNTVFVLATTEAHKVMPTIVDRCQRFDFARPSPDDIAEVVRRAARAEEIEVEDVSVAAIARAANGSFRDALGTLDQLLAYSGKQIGTDDVLTVLGVADADLLFEAAEAIAASDGRRVLAVAERLAASGRDPSRFAGDLVAHLRRLLVVGTVGEVPEHFFLAPEQEEQLLRQSRALGEVALVRAIDELSAAIAAIREGDEPRMTLELALLRAARPEIDPSRQALAQRLERLERALAGEGGAVLPAGYEGPATGGSGPAPAADPPSAPESAPPTQPQPPTPPAPAAPAPAADHASAPPAAEPPASVPQSAEPPAPRPPVDEGGAPQPADPAGGEHAPASPAALAEPSDVDLPRLLELWPAVLEQIRGSGAELLAAAFAAARPTAFDAGRVEIGFPPGAAFNKRKAEAKESRERLAEALQAIVGARLVPSYAMLDEEPAAEQAPAVEAPLDERELLERLKSEFDAEELIDDPEEGSEHG